MSILSTNVGKKSLETEFLIAICRPTGDKWQSKTLFLVIFDPRSLIVKSVFDCRYKTPYFVNMDFSFNPYSPNIFVLKLLSALHICCTPGPVAQSVA